MAPCRAVFGVIDDSVGDGAGLIVKLNVELDPADVTAVTPRGPTAASTAIVNVVVAVVVPETTILPTVTPVPETTMDVAPWTKFAPDRVTFTAVP